MNDLHVWAMSGDAPPESGNDSTGSGSAPEPALPAWARRRSPIGELSDENLAVFIGPRWKSTYRSKLAPFRDDPAFVPTWNWAAAFGGALWFLYRKLYLAFAAFVILPSVALQLLAGSDTQLTGTNVMAPENRWLLELNIAVVVSGFIAAGGSANWFLFRRARAAIRLVALQDLPAAESQRLLARIGGVNRGGLLFMLAISVMTMLATLRA
jgi:hypothetical protein